MSTGVSSVDELEQAERTLTRTRESARIRIRKGVKKLKRKASIESNRKKSNLFSFGANEWTRTTDLGVMNPVLSPAELHWQSMVAVCASHKLPRGLENVYLANNLILVSKLVAEVWIEHTTSRLWALRATTALLRDIWCQWVGSNHRPRGYESRALTSWATLACLWDYAYALYDALAKQVWL